MNCNKCSQKSQWISPVGRWNHAILISVRKTRPTEWVQILKSEGLTDFRTSCMINTWTNVTDPNGFVTCSTPAAWPRLGRVNNPSLISQGEGSWEIVTPPCPWWSYFFVQNNGSIYSLTSTTIEYLGTVLRLGNQHWQSSLRWLVRGPHDPLPACCYYLFHCCVHRSTSRRYRRHPWTSCWFAHVW